MTSETQNFAYEEIFIFEFTNWCEGSSTKSSEGGEAKNTEAAIRTYKSSQTHQKDFLMYVKACRIVFVESTVIQANLLSNDNTSIVAEF